MQYSIVFSSRTGNTAVLAEALKDCLPEAGRVFFGPPGEEALSASLLCVGFWTDKGLCDEQTAFFLGKLHGKQVALFGTAGFGGEQGYFDSILARTKTQLPADNILLPGFMCQGKMQPAVRERYEAMLRQSPGDKRMTDMIENFDRALTHPNQADLARLREWVAALPL